MSTWPIYVMVAATLTGVLAWVVLLALLLVVTARGAVSLIRPLVGSADVTEAEDATPLDSCVWLACHTTQCGHMQTRHDITESGRLVCRGCGQAAVQG
ncbi:hypothetical protein [Streptomyces sp. NPDC056707]|uniref:hypothetical protein n=1 Tax=Streptomyces sp. NPDC056707 TaxID=3345919 RepID=UPI0036A7E4BC